VKRYRLSPEAQGDIEDIRKYLVKEGGAALARYVLGEIRQALRFLAETPGAGHARDDLTDEPVNSGRYFLTSLSMTPPRSRLASPAFCMQAGISKRCSTINRRAPTDRGWGVLQG
jgi:plasmid stabilization system protein ParE